MQGKRNKCVEELHPISRCVLLSNVVISAQIFQLRTEMFFKIFLNFLDDFLF